MDTNQADFTVMTCNLGNGRANNERLIQVLHTAEADVIGLQEVSHGQAGALATRLSDSYPYQALFPGGFAGKALLSRYPLLESEQLQLSSVRPDLLASVKIGGQRLSLIVAHPPPPHLTWRGIQFDPQTWRQILALAQIAVERRPAILLGDFNLVDRMKAYARLRSAGLQDAFAVNSKKSGYTLPKRIGPWRRLQAINRILMWLPLIPILRVDYIWYTAELNSLDAWVGEDTGSDHLPVLARLALAEI